MSAANSNNNIFGHNVPWAAIEYFPPCRFIQTLTNTKGMTVPQVPLLSPFVPFLRIEAVKVRLVVEYETVALPPV